MKAKPKPPANLWEQLDAALGVSSGEPPEGAFTMTDYARNGKLPWTTAQGRVQTLVRIGKIKQVGVWRGRKYFILV